MQLLATPNASTLPSVQIRCTENTRVIVAVKVANMDSLLDVIEFLVKWLTSHNLLFSWNTSEKWHSKKVKRIRDWLELATTLANELILSKRKTDQIYWCLNDELPHISSTENATAMLYKATAPQELRLSNMAAKRGVKSCESPL